jgi:hypothetical protein
LERPQVASALALAGAALLAAAGTLRAARPPGVPVARVVYVDDLVELSEAGRGPRRVSAGHEFRTGETLRTGPNATARVEFPWMTVSLAAATRLSLPESAVLATVLEHGRIEQFSQGGDIIKLLTSEALVRGEGRVVVRREAETTFVSARAGSFQAEGAGRVVALVEGQGTVVRKGAQPAPARPLPAAPSGLLPGADPVYVEPGVPFALSWRSSQRGLHHVEILGIDSDDVLISRDVPGPPAQLTLDWPGTFRWRVSRRDEAGLESAPSEEGLITVFK